MTNPEEQGPVECKCECKHHQDGPRKGERKAYIVLVVISLFFSVAAGSFGLYQANIVGKKFCDVISPAVIKVVQKPHQPPVTAKEKDQEDRYEAYLKVVRLAHALGCI